MPHKFVSSGGFQST